MALDSTLAIDGPFRQADIEAVLGASGFAANPDDARVWQHHGVVAVVGGFVDHFHRLRKAFGFDPATRVLFTVDKGDGYAAGMTAMVAATAAVLAAMPDDAVLLANHEAPLLVRQDGVVTLTTRDDWWQSMRPPLLTLLLPGYRQASLPVL